MKFWRIEHTEPTGERIATWYPTKRAAMAERTVMIKEDYVSNIDMSLVEVPTKRAALLWWLNKNAGGQAI